MAITNYGELKTAVASELNRSDVTSKVPEWVLLGESRINRELRLPDMVTTATGTLSTASRTLAIPDRYLDKRQFRINDPIRELIYRAPETLLDGIPENDSGGTPRFFTVTDTFLFDRIPDAEYSYTLVYYKSYKLSGDTDTNYVLTNYPQVYLYASVMYGALWAKDFEHARVMSDVLVSEINSLKKSEAKRKSANDARLETELNTRQAYSIDHD